MMHAFIKLTILFIFSLMLSGCGTRDGLAPLIELKGNSNHRHGLQHKVVRGETLYAIAFYYNEDYLHLAKLNHLRSPFTLRVGQIIYLAPPPKLKPQRMQARPITVTNYLSSSGGWLWPVSGQVRTTYNPQQGKKGIDVIGRRGDKIHASSGGVVAYAGNGLAGYGNLIIIKHANNFLTAYGNNSRNLVKEGQTVKAGQVIAIIGMVNRQQWGVHFEIRKSGEPVNPMNYLR